MKKDVTLTVVVVVVGVVCEWAHLDVLSSRASSEPLHLSYTGWGKSYGGLEFLYNFCVHSHEELRLAVETLT